jgi:hypothetical protein
MNIMASLQLVLQKYVNDEAKTIKKGLLLKNVELQYVAYLDVGNRCGSLFKTRPSLIFLLKMEAYRQLI